MEVSDCHTGAVAVFKPFPSPATILPTIIWGTEYAVICRIAPMLITVVPTRIDFFLPKRSPMEKAAIAPKKQLLNNLQQSHVLDKEGMGVMDWR